MSTPEKDLQDLVEMYIRLIGAPRVIEAVRNACLTSAESSIAAIALSVGENAGPLAEGVICLPPSRHAH